MQQDASPKEDKDGGLFLISFALLLIYVEPHDSVLMDRSIVCSIVPA